MDELAVPLSGALEKAGGPYRVAVVLGSAFGGAESIVADPEVFEYTSLEGYPSDAPPVPGQAGRLLLGDVGGKPTAVFSGRLQLYQDVSAVDAAWTVRLAASLGAETVIVTAASGAVSGMHSVGDVVLIEDHINLTGTDPLVGWTGHPGSSPFVNMRDAYDPQLRSLAFDVAAEQGVTLSSGTYVGVTGPSYETPSEVQMLRNLDADIVGMSVVCEVIAARALGIRVIGLSVVANDAADPDLSHEAVLESGRRGEDVFVPLISGLIERL